ncbi:MAG: undecaprenyl-phosphate galactose phosphotransferase WbaP [Desulfocucumaceae bacterium]
MRRVMEVAALVVVDLLAFFGLLSIAYLIRMYFLPVFIHDLPEGLSPATLTQIFWFPLVAVLSFAFSGLYSRRLPWMQEMGMLARGSAFSVLVSLAALFALKESGQISRLLIMLTWVNSLWLVPLARLSARKILIGLGFWRRDVIIVGSGKLVKRVYEALNSDLGIGYKVLGVVLPEDVADGGEEIPLLGRWGNIEDILSQTGVRDVVIASPGIGGHEVGELVALLQQRAENVLFVPDIHGLPVLGADVGYFFDQHTLIINFKNNLKIYSNIIAKRLFDISVGTAIALVALPLLACLAIAMAADSRGRILYRQERVGRKDSIFYCYKFRTMVSDADRVLSELIGADSSLAEEWDRGHKLKNDPRITRVGGFLRKYSLDELPQLINVLKGDMSLVGPRPVVRGEIERYGSFSDYYYSVRPGLSGLWQVSGRNDTDYETRVMLDSWYVRNWSLWLDIYILARTARVVIRGKGAY